MTASYSLTEKQRQLLAWFVQEVRKKRLSEEFLVIWANSQGVLPHYKGEWPPITKGALDALAAAGLIISTPSFKTETTQSGGISRPRVTSKEREYNRRCTLTQESYDAVDSNFAAPDTTFVTHLTPLADVTNLDPEIKSRCLPILGAGSADPKLWDSAVRTAGVILEERLRDIGRIENGSLIGLALVNKIFGAGGTLSNILGSEAKRQSYRDLYAGAVGTLRNPFAHRLIDPEPEDGGALILFVNLLLRMLEDLRREEGKHHE